MKYLNNHFHKLTTSKYSQLVDVMKVEVNQFFDNFYDDPNFISEWGHYYFCNIDGGRLIFEMNNPHVHRCEICNHEYKGAPYDGVWWYFYRNEAVITMLKASAVYQATKDEKYLNILKSLISFYANNYQIFPIHNKEHQVFSSYAKMAWGCGRILPQGLNEAIITVRMIQALEMVKDDLSQDFKDDLYHKMFKEIFYLLKPQVNRIHNISCWKNSAIGMMGLFFQDEEMLSFAFSGPYNILRQIEEGVTSDYFWYEGSIHYNYFTLEGISMLILFSKIYNYHLDQKAIDKVEQMFIAGYHFAFNNLYFPNPNDGWPSLNLKTYSYIYHVMAKVLGYDSEIGNILKIISKDHHPRTQLPLSKPYYLTPEMSFEHFVLNTDFADDDSIPYPQKTCNFPRSNYGIIRNHHFNVFLKYGHNSPSHAHPDCMNIEVMAGDDMITRDLSNAGYRARLCDEWHRTSASHSTVVVDGKNQTSTHPGQTISYNEHEIAAFCEDVYEGVSYNRRLKLEDNSLIDEFKIISLYEHVYDYFFHFEAGVKFEEILKEPSDLGFNQDGYQHISDIYKISSSDKIFSLKVMINDQSFYLDIDSVDKELFLVKTLDNPVNRARTSLVIRARGKNVQFNLTLQKGE